MANILSSKKKILPEELVKIYTKIKPPNMDLCETTHLLSVRTVYKTYNIVVKKKQPLEVESRCPARQTNVHINEKIKLKNIPITARENTARQHTP